MLKDAGLDDVVPGTGLGPDFTPTFAGMGAHQGQTYIEFAGQGPNQGIIWFKSQRNRGTQTPAIPPHDGGLLGQVGNLFRHLVPMGASGGGIEPGPIIDFPVVLVP